MAARGALLCAASFSLSACVPFFATYYRVEAEAGVHLKNICHGSAGPASMTYFPSHGIFLSFDPEWLQLGLHLPEGTTSQLDGHTVDVDGVTPKGPYHGRFEIRAVNQGATGNGAPAEFRGLSDPFESGGDFGPFAGYTKDGRYIWHLFVGVVTGKPGHLVQLPENLTQGTITLPPMTINGHSYGPLSLPFTPVTYRGVVPVNC